MSPKELLYIEDALGHNKSMQSACVGFAQQLQDPELKAFVTQLGNKHNESFATFFALL